MRAFLFTMSILLGIFNILSHQWFTLIPWLGMSLLYRIRWLQAAVALTSVAFGFAAYRLAPGVGSAIWFGLIVLLTLLAGKNDPAHYLIPVYRTGSTSAEEADLSPDAPVIGVAIGREARAYPLELVVPHHIVHDRVGDTAIVVCW